MAKVAAQTGISPQALADLDGDMWAALVHAVDTRWTQIEEMLTFQAELLHELVRVTLGVHGQQVMPPLHLPRPADLARPARGRLSSHDDVAMFVRGLGGGGHG